MTTVAEVAHRSSRTFEDTALLRELGHRIRDLRVERGLTQEGLVDRTGVDRSHLASIENGRGNPTVRTLARVARGLHVGIGELFEVHD